MSIPHSQQLRVVTDDPFINLLACVWEAAFADAAAADHQARAEILDFFGVTRVQQLYQTGCIAWDPAAVARQLLLEV